MTRATKAKGRPVNRESSLNFSQLLTGPAYALPALQASTAPKYVTRNCEQHFLVRQDEIRRRRLYFLVTKSELVYIGPS